MYVDSVFYHLTFSLACGKKVSLPVDQLNSEKIEVVVQFIVSNIHEYLSLPHQCLKIIVCNHFRHMPTQFRHLKSDC